MHVSWFPRKRLCQVGVATQTLPNPLGFAHQAERFAFSLRGVRETIAVPAERNIRDDQHYVRVDGLELI